MAQVKRTKTTPTVPPPAMMGIDDERREKFSSAAARKAHERGESKTVEASEQRMMPRKKF